jgi:7,8-dihydropterin-6-yl-methyl-4-(beta-D-ribofuranosyl)aminobenzene 5'-phosphate synthase
MRISVVFENEAAGGFIPAWGLSVLVETDFGNRVLFDTGSSGAVWFHNAKRMGFDYDSFDHVFISHFHWDHMAAALDIAHFAKAEKHFLITDGFSKIFAAELAKNGHQVSLVREPYRFSDELFSLGGMETGIGNLYEHSLVVFDNDGGYSLFVGCSHPGIVEIVTRAVEFTEKPPRLVLGGFHLKGLDVITITAVAEELLKLGVEYVAPCHCTGEEGREIFASVFGKRYIDVKAGSVLEL